MIIVTLFDVGLSIIAVGVAAWTVAVRETFRATIGFVVYGLLLSLVWVRLSAVDVALTEAGIGSGVTGVLLLGAAYKMRTSDATGTLPGLGLRIVVGALCAIISVALAAVVLMPACPAPTLAPDLVKHLPSLQVGNGIAGVLKGFRALDTLLEAVVLLIALIAIWSLAADSDWNGAPRPWRLTSPNDTLTFTARVLPPIGTVVGIYIVWVGSDAPGGAFQGSSILGAMWILAMMAGLVAPPRNGSMWLRMAVVIGPVVFILVGLSGFALAGYFLAYPPAFAKLLMVMVEVAVALSIAVTLGMMVAGPPAGAGKT